MPSVPRLSLVATAAVVLAVGVAVLAVALGSWSTDDGPRHSEQAVPLLRLSITPESAHHPTTFEDAQVRPDGGFHTDGTRRVLHLQEPVGDLEMAVVVDDHLRPRAERPSVVLLDQAYHDVRFGNATTNLRFSMNFLVGETRIALENVRDPTPCPATATFTNATGDPTTYEGPVGVLGLREEGERWEVHWKGDTADIQGCPRMTLHLGHEGTWTVRAPVPEPEPRSFRSG